MKKSIARLLLIALTLVMIFSFASCDMLPQLGKHEHAFDDYYSYDSENHYFACECGEVDQVAEHIDESGDGLCDACEYEMYVPTTVYTVSITVGEGVTVTQTSYVVEEENDLTFTATVDAAYELTVSGAKIIGEPVIDGGVATYTLKVIYVVSDVDVNLGCELIQLPCEHEWTSASCDAAETCALCGETKGVALGHVYEARLVAPTCTEVGYTSHTCTRCGDNYTTNEVAPLGHTEADVAAVAPGCETTGLTAGKKCSVCDEILVAQDEVSALGHTEAEIPAVAPGCVVTGLTSGVKCSVCDKVLVEPTVVEALGHTEKVDVAVAPTCDENGLTAGKHCSVCNEVLVPQVTIDALGHVEVVDAGVAPTCIATGLTEGKHCSVCESVTVAQNVIAALGHDYKAVVTAATCTADGYTTYTCNNCGDSYVADEVAALGHDYKATVTAPTCLAGGYTTYTCAVCTDSYVADEVAALGHDYKATVTAPTCLAGGYTTYNCAACNDSYIGDEVEASGHNWKAATCTTPQICLTCKTMGEAALGHNYADATCTEASTCQNCGNKKGSALGHSWVNATCDAPKTCSVCLVTEGEVAPHNYVASVKKPTCLEGGYTTYTCSKCSDSYVADETPAAGHKGGVATCENDGVCTVCNEVYITATGHNYVETVVVPTCLEGGYTTHICENCNRSYVDNKVDALGHSGGTATCTEGAVCENENCGTVYIDAIGHNYEATTTAPTCTEEGYTTHTCLNCGNSYDDTVVAAKGHKETAEVTDPTCLVGGYTTYTCEVCGNEEQREPKDPLGHNEVVDEAVEPKCEEVGYTEGSHCGRCGEILVAPEEIEAIGHDYSSEVIAPTCTEDGYTKYTCANCSGIYSDSVVDKLGHSYESTVVDPTCSEVGYTTYVCATCGDTYQDDELPATGNHDWIYGDKLWQCSTCNAVEYEITLGGNEFAISTGTGFDAYGYAISNDIVVRFVASEAGEYYITSESGILSVNGEHVEEGEKYNFTITEDNLEIVFTLGVKSRTANRGYSIDAIVKKVQNKPNTPPTQTSESLSGVISEDGYCLFEITFVAGTYNFITDIEGEYTVIIEGISNGVYAELVGGGEFELLAGDYNIVVVFDSDVEFTLTYTNLSANNSGESLSGVISEDGYCLFEITFVAGTYNFVTDIEGEYTVIIEGISNGVYGELVGGGEFELLAGDYNIVVVYESNTEFILTYTMLSSGDASDNTFTLNEDAFDYELVVTEAGYYTFTVVDCNFDIEGSVGIDNGLLIFGEAIYLEEGAYLISASVGPGEYVTIEYTFEA